MSQLANIVQFQMTGNGPYMIAQSAINPWNVAPGRTAQASDFRLRSQARCFRIRKREPQGTLQRRAFSGPWSFDLDASIQKNIKITERQSVEVRMEGVNVLNHPTFWVGDQNINSNTFGAVASMLNSPRIMQFGLKYRF